MKYIKWFNEVRISDIGLVGGKNASLGEMISQLSSHGIRVPFGFCITSEAYWYYIEANGIRTQMEQLLEQLHDIHNLHHLQKIGSSLRNLFILGTIPNDLREEIETAYKELAEKVRQDEADVAIRSSATAEDLPNASFAGQQDTFLNISGEAAIIDACKKSFASLFTDRAIVYRHENGFDHFKVALSIGVQQMIRSDLAESGVAFSIDPQTGHSEMIVIESSYGLGESIVQGSVIPDFFTVHKPTLKQGHPAIIKRMCGEKATKIIYSTDRSATTTQTVSVPGADRIKYSITDDEVITLARFVLDIEDHYSQINGHKTPMDIEWAKDGRDGKLYIIQARPETVHRNIVTSRITSYTLVCKEAPTPLVQGISIGNQIASGTARIVENIRQLDHIQPGDILITDMTDPDWVPIMKLASGIITNRGGRTCHAAIVSRELGIPAIVGTIRATSCIRNGQEITIDCSQGESAFVYDGLIPFVTQETVLDTLQKPPCNLMVNIANPDQAFSLSFLPVNGVGLARIEFIIAHNIQIHPLALLYPEKITDPGITAKIQEITVQYPDKKRFFIEKLTEGIATIAAAFYPRPVVVRLSDFKTNEYRNLIGGSFFEPIEQNPMLGLRGASRYYHPHFEAAFSLECEALSRAIFDLGFKNIRIMVPFVRTVSEGKKIQKELSKNGLVQGKSELSIIMMCEVPSNVILIDQFSKQFDGFSIGSNDLTQLVLGVDRDSSDVSSLFNEQDDAIKWAIKRAIDGAHENKKTIGICGQAPSDFPEFASFVIDCGIDSISLNADSVIPFLMHYSKNE